MNQPPSDSFPGWILGVVSGLLLMGVGGLFGLLWAIKSSISNLSTDVRVLTSQHNEHGRRIGVLEVWREDAQPKLDRLYHVQRAARQSDDIPRRAD